MSLYRAFYLAASGRLRKMTFAHAGGIKAALRFAEVWELRDDKLQRVDWLRECERPVLRLEG